MVSIQDFQKLEFKIAEVVDVKPHPNADRLYVIDIKIGEESRQVVAGIKAHYTPEELKGKKVVVVANLEPAVIRGVESQGMILAASTPDKLAILTPEKDIASGAQVR